MRWTYIGHLTRLHKIRFMFMFMFKEIVRRNGEKKRRSTMTVRTPKYVRAADVESHLFHSATLRYVPVAWTELSL